MDIDKHMSVDSRVAQGTTIVDVTGQIDIGNSPALRKILLDTLAGVDRLAVNMGAVRYIDSSGIASLVEALKQARNSKKRLLLYGLTPKVLHVFQLTRLTNLFEICESEEQAVAAKDS